MKKESGQSARVLFARNLNRYMELRGVNQADIVARLGVSSATASDWVSGSKYPRVDAMQALADLLDVQMSDLMTEQTASSTDTIREKLRRQPGMRLMFDAADGATEAQLEKFAKVIRTLRDDE